MKWQHITVAVVEEDCAPGCRIAFLIWFIMSSTVRWSLAAPYWRASISSVNSTRSVGTVPGCSLCLGIVLYPSVIQGAERFAHRAPRSKRHSATGEACMYTVCGCAASGGGAKSRCIPVRDTTIDLRTAGSLPPVSIDDSVFDECS